MAVKPLALEKLHPIEPPLTSLLATVDPKLKPLTQVWEEFTSRHAPAYMQLGTKSSSPRSMREYSLDKCQVIGQGGDSAILLLTHEKHGQMALKITEKAGRRPEQIGRSRFEAYFLVERANHPNIVRAYDWVETPDHILMAMEYSTFGDMLDLLNLRKSFSESESSKIIAQLAHGLNAAHDMGIVHGDVKLENILLFRANPEEQARFGMKHRVVLCDWGFARPAGHLLVRSFGSVFYTAPEVLTLAGALTTAADMWGLGIILYSILCACLPFREESMPALKEDISRARYKFPPGLTISDNAKDLTSKLLSVDPASRPTATSVLQHPWFISALSTASPRKGGAASQTTAAH